MQKNDKNKSFLKTLTLTFLASSAMAIGLVADFNVNTQQPLSAAEAKRKKVKTGETQVVASLDGREITLNELRIEIAMMKLDPTHPNSERLALQSIIDRSLLVKAAKEQNIHKQPEAVWRMNTAKDGALSELYINLISRPAEPTRTDIESFMLENPSLFSEAKRYTFDVLEIATTHFDAEEMTPLFDETQNFEDMIGHLKAKDVDFNISQTIRPSSSFPDHIRKQLMVYGVSDNIILQNELQTNILKITKVEDAQISTKDGAPIARQFLRQEDSKKRIRQKLDSIRHQADIDIYRETAKPVEETTEKEAAVKMR